MLAVFQTDRRMSFMTIRSKGVRWHEFAGKSWSTNDYAFLIIFGFSNHFEIAIATAATIYDLGHHAVHATTKGLFWVIPIMLIIIINF